MSEPTENTTTESTGGESLTAPMIDAARAWMNTNYSQAKITQPDWYHNKLGSLVDFILDVYGSAQQ